MNEQHAKTNGRALTCSIWKTPALVAASVLLAGSFWMASLPIAQAKAITPAEMIQAHLPHAMSLTSAPKAELLSAVCQAVTKNRKEAPQIVRTAADARKEYTADILKTAVHCLHTDAEHPDCELAHLILKEAIAADNDQADSLTELFLQVAPGCADSPEEGPNGNFNNVSNLNGAPGSLGGGSAASGETCSVCHANQSIQVACSELNSYLRGHPGDTAGACEATPNANR